MQEIRDKWKNLQSHAKREFSSFKSEQKKTGGGPAPPNPSKASLLRNGQCLACTFIQFGMHADSWESTKVA